MPAEVGQGTSVKSSASPHFVTGRPVGLEQDLPQHPEDCIMP